MNETFNTVIKNLDSMHYGWWDLVTEEMVSDGRISNTMYEKFGYPTPEAMRHKLCNGGQQDPFTKANKSPWHGLWIEAIKARKGIVGFLDERHPNWRTEMKKEQAGGFVGLWWERWGFENFDAAMNEIRNRGLWNIVAFDRDFWDVVLQEPKVEEPKVEEPVTVTMVIITGDEIEQRFFNGEPTWAKVQEHSPQLGLLNLEKAGLKLDDKVRDWRFGGLLTVNVETVSLIPVV